MMARFTSALAALRVGTALCLISAPAVAQERTQAEIIKAKMRELAVLSGSWNVAYTFHRGPGPSDDTHEVGVEVVSWTLDSTYLRGETERHPVRNTANRRLQLTMLTFNP